MKIGNKIQSKSQQVQFKINSYLKTYRNNKSFIIKGFSRTRLLLTVKCGKLIRIFLNKTQQVQF